MSHSIPVSRIDGQARGLPPAPFGPQRNRAPRPRRRYHCTQFPVSATRWNRLHPGREGKHKSEGGSNSNRTAHNLLATNPFASFSPTASLSRRWLNTLQALLRPVKKPEIGSRSDVGWPSSAASCGEGFRLPRTVQRLTNKLPCAVAPGMASPYANGLPAAGPTESVFPATDGQTHASSPSGILRTVRVSASSVLQPRDDSGQPRDAPLIYRTPR